MLELEPSSPMMCLAGIGRALLSAVHRVDDLTCVVPSVRPSFTLSICVLLCPSISTHFIHASTLRSWLQSALEPHLPRRSVLGILRMHAFSKHLSHLHLSYFLFSHTDHGPAIRPRTTPPPSFCVGHSAHSSTPSQHLIRHGGVALPGSVCHVWG